MKKWIHQIRYASSFSDVSSDFPEILRSRNRDLKTTHNNFRGYHLTRLLLFFFFVNLARNSRKFNLFFEGKEDV